LVKILSVVGIVAVIAAICAGICWCAKSSNTQTQQNQGNHFQAQNQTSNWNGANEGWNNQQGGWNAQGGNNNGRVELTRNSYN